MDLEVPEEIETISSIPPPSGLTPHDPVGFVGNSQLNNTASAEGWSGNGTAGNPYVIENLSIDAFAYSNFICMEIRDTTLHILLKDCVLFNTTYGIYIWKSHNITIWNTTIYDCSMGVYVYGGPTTIDGCTIYNTTKYGIYIDGGPTTIDGCSIYNATESGIYADGNVGHDRYLINNSEIHGCESGIYSKDNVDIEIIGNFIHNNTMGIGHCDSDDPIEIIGNRIDDNEIGVGSWGDLILMGNLFSRNIKYGLFFHSGSSYTSEDIYYISDNMFVGGGYGIYHYNHMNITDNLNFSFYMINNIISEFTNYGIYFDLFYRNYENKISLFGNKLTGCPLSYRLIVPPLDLDIPQNNTVDGSPIVYINETSTWENTTIPDRIGQLIFEGAGGWDLNGVTVLGGILAHLSRNIKIKGSDIDGYQDGLLVYDSKNITIMRSDIHRAVNGTRFVWSNDCTIWDNTIHDCLFGIIIDHSGDFTLFGNALTGCTITFDYSYLADLSILGIPHVDENNTINGLPIFYRYSKNMMNARITVANRSMIILIDVVNLNIHDFQSTGFGCGVILLGCSFINFGNCSIVNETITAVNIQFCDHVYIRDSSFFGNDDAIFFHNNYICYVEDCSFVNNTGRSVFVERADTSHYRILNNSFLGNNMGIVQNYRVKDIVIQGNLFLDNILSFDAGYACSNLVWNNSFISGPNTEEMILVSYSTNWDNDGYGNYYSTYHGVDGDLDWIGDTPYRVSHHSTNEDKYPLMYSPHIPPPELNVYDGRDNITLIWKAPEVMDIFEITGYEIIRKSNYDKKIIANVSAKNLTYVDGSLSESNGYWYHVRAVVRYVNGPHSINGTASDQVLGVLDHEPPVIEIISPQDNSMLDTRTLKIEWNCFERLSPMKEFLYKIDDGEFQSVSYDSREVFIRDVEDGPHIVVVRAVDWHENHDEDSVSFTIDATGPNITLISPKPFACLSSRDLRIQWTADDEYCNVVSYEMKIDKEVMALGEDVRVFDAKDLEVGTHRIMVTAWDSLNNRATIASTFTIDVTPPEIFIQYPVDGDFYNETNITAEWDVYDLSTYPVFIDISFDDDDWMDITDTDHHTFTNLSEGTHIIYFRIRDSAGNSNTADVRFVVDISDPLFEIISPDNGGRFSNGNVTFQLDGSDFISGMGGLRYKIDGKGFWYIDYRNELKIPDLNPGMHWIEIWAYDKAGNFEYEERMIIIDVECPVVLNVWPRSEIEPGTPIYIEFSEEMRIDTVEILIPGSSIEVEWSGNVARVTITRYFLYNHFYELRVLDGEDLAGNHINKWNYYIQTVDRAWIHGYVKDEDGLALEDIAVYLDYKMICFTDPDGYFNLTSTTGAHELRLTHPSYLDNATSIEAGPGEHVVLKRITMYGIEEEGSKEFHVNPLIPILVSLVLLILIAVEGYVIFRRRSEKMELEE